jgi:tRNA uridine 5-carboxymethylaminomethyl modification enzyme
LKLVDDQRWHLFEEKRSAITKVQTDLASSWIRPDTTQAEQAEETWGKPLLRETTAMDLLRRPEVDVDNLLSLIDYSELPEQVSGQIAIQAKYAGYIKRQQSEIERAKRHDSLRLPDHIDYTNVSGLSNEVSEKLKQQQPETLGQASRIPGVTPAAISLLLVYLKKTA